MHLTDVGRTRACTALRTHSHSLSHTHGEPYQGQTLMHLLCVCQSMVLSSGLHQQMMLHTHWMLLKLLKLSSPLISTTLYRFSVQREHIWKPLNNAQRDRTILW